MTDHTTPTSGGEVRHGMTAQPGTPSARYGGSSLTHLGRSAVFLVGTQDPLTNDLLLTVTAATPKPVQLRFERMPKAGELGDAIEAAIPDDGYFDDVHGSPAYRRKLTFHFAEEIRAELEAMGRR